MMIDPKRLATKSIEQCNGKLKDLLSSPPHKCEEILEADLTQIPVIKRADNFRLLPKYTVLAKADFRVSMDDLDLLQKDLETLLSSTIIRITHLLSEIEKIDKNENNHERKEYDKMCMKRKQPDEKNQFTDLKNGMRVFKKNYGLPANKLLLKSTILENDNSDKFWASIEPYCTNVNKDDVEFLDCLIQEVSKEIDVKIPEVGEHYANTWLEEIINEEQNSNQKSSHSELKRHGLNLPYTQKLLAAFVEERVLNALPENGDNFTNPPKLKFLDIKLKLSSNQKLGTCLDRRFKRELIEQGITTLENLSKNLPEDEILTEIKKCQQELATVNEYNIEELNKLKTVVCNDVHSNELKDQLDKIDKQVLDLYNKMIITRITSAQDDDDEVTKDFDSLADTLLKHQVELNREINSLTDMQMMY